MKQIELALIVIQLIVSVIALIMAILKIINPSEYGGLSKKLQNAFFVIFFIGLILAGIRNATATSDLLRALSFITGVATTIYLTVNIGMRYSK